MNQLPQFTDFKNAISTLNISLNAINTLMESGQFVDTIMAQGYDKNYAESLMMFFQVFEKFLNGYATEINNASLLG